MFRLAVAVAVLFATGVPLARGDVYTWTDANGKVNVSNLTPPDGANVSNVVHETPRPPVPPAPIVVAAAPQADVQFLAERIRQLEYEVQSARRQPTSYPMEYAPMPPPPVVQYAAEPAEQPSYPSYGCNPEWYGCWSGWNGFGFGGYPVVVLSTPGFHRPFAGRGFHRSPMLKTPMPVQMPVRGRGGPGRR